MVPALLSQPLPFSTARECLRIGYKMAAGFPSGIGAGGWTLLQAGFKAGEITGSCVFGAGWQYTREVQGDLMFVYLPNTTCFPMRGQGRAWHSG